MKSLLDVDTFKAKQLLVAFRQLASNEESQQFCRRINEFVSTFYIDSKVLYVAEYLKCLKDISRRDADDFTLNGKRLVSKRSF